MVKAKPICFVLLRQAAPVPLSFALLKAGNNIAAKIAMIAMTTSNSIKVKPLRQVDDIAHYKVNSPDLSTRQKASQGERRWRSFYSFLLADQMLDVLAGNGKNIHVGLNGAEADEAFSKQLAGAKLQLLCAEFCHALQNMLAFAHVRSLIRPNVIRDVNQQRVVPLFRRFDQMVDCF